MTRPGTLLAILVITLLLAAGCTSPSAKTNATATVTPTSTQSAALYKVTVSQPDAYAGYIHMDTDLYNAGEVVEFVVVNGGKTDLKSPNDHPDFSVKFQTGHGTWATKLGTDYPVVSNASVLRPGESSKVYRFIPAGWEVGRYRIVSDYGVSRDFLVRAGTAPVLATNCTPATNTTPWITIDPIPDHVAGEQFTITGKTNVAPGQEIRYTIFAPGVGSALIPLGTPVSITSVAGPCGNNTWSADVMLPDASVYFIGIAESTKTASAIERFTVLPAPASAAAARGTPSPGKLASPSVNGAPVPPTPQLK